MPKITAEFHSHTDTMYIDVYKTDEPIYDLWLTSRVTEQGTHIALLPDVAEKVAAGLTGGLIDVQE